MKPRHSAALIAAALMGCSGPASALERAAARAPRHPEVWSASATVSLAYYNTCTGWIWQWSGFESGDEFGVVYDLGSVDLLSLTQFIVEGYGIGYGHTGSIDIVPVDSLGTPTGAPLASQPWSPRDRGPDGEWYTTAWGGLRVDAPFSVRITWDAGSGFFPNPTRMATDHPTAGATGPTACGHCFPSDRANQSYQWKTSGIPVLPGDPFFDGSCNAELMWVLTYIQHVNTPVQDTSWGSLKALYR